MLILRIFYFFLLAPVKELVSKLEDSYVIKYETGVSASLKPFKIIRNYEDLDCLIACTQLVACNSVNFLDKNCRMYSLLYSYLKIFLLKDDSKTYIKKNSISKLRAS